MLGLINRKLNDLIRPLDAIRREDAEIAARAVSKKLLAVVDAYIVDIYRKRNGGNGPYILDPFVSERSDDVEKASLVIVNEEKGILPWVQKNGKIAWIDDVKNKNWEEPVLNLAATEGIRAEMKLPEDVKLDDEYIQPSATLNSFSPHTECILTYPLKHRNQVWGVLSIELKNTKVFDRKLNVELFKTAKHLACLIWKSDVQHQNESDTNEAVKEFEEILSKQEEEVIPLTRFPSGFIARSFDDEGKFYTIEKLIQNCLKHIEINHSQDEGKPFIINEIIRDIRRSHFCIADITGMNANVLIELGMMMNDSDKKDKIIIIKDIDDDNTVPFDINQHTVYLYTIKDEKLIVKDASGGPELLFEPILNELTKKYIRKDV